MPNKIKVVGVFASFLMVVVMSCACGSSNAQDAGKGATNAASFDYQNVRWGMAKDAVYKATGDDGTKYEPNRKYHGFDMMEVYRYEKDLLNGISINVDVLAWAHLTNDLVKRFGAVKMTRENEGRTEFIWEDSRTRVIAKVIYKTAYLDWSCLLDLTGSNNKL